MQVLIGVTHCRPLYAEPKSAKIPQPESGYQIVYHDITEFGLIGLLRALSQDVSSRRKTSRETPSPALEQCRQSVRETIIRHINL
jgi:hypothetical protein